MKLLKLRADIAIMEQLIDECVEFTGVTFGEMLAKDRKNKHVEARYYTIKVLNDNKCAPLATIAQIFNIGYRDAWRAIKKINGLIETKQFKTKEI